MSQANNVVCLTGYVNKEPDVRQTNTGMTILTGRIGVKRIFAKKDQQQFDGINIKMFGKTAENAQNWMEKGRQVQVTGSLHVDEYDKNGSKQFYTYISVDNFQMVGKREDAVSDAASLSSASNKYISELDDGEDIPPF
jgi:single-strand DNA-binding protein